VILPVLTCRIKGCFAYTISLINLVYLYLLIRSNRNRDVLLQLCKPSTLHASDCCYKFYSAPPSLQFVWGVVGRWFSSPSLKKQLKKKRNRNCGFCLKKNYNQTEIYKYPSKINSDTNEVFNFLSLVFSSFLGIVRFLMENILQDSLLVVQVTVRSVNNPRQ